MQSTGHGPHYHGAEHYQDTNYDPINSHQIPSNNYIPYQSSSYTSHYNNSHPISSEGSHYNSPSPSHVYGPQVNHYSDPYTGNPRYMNPNNMPMRPAIASKQQFWNNDSQIQENSRNFNQSGALPPPLPPLTSRPSQAKNNSPTMRTSQCNATNNYTPMSGHHTSPSPQGWSHSPNMMQSSSSSQSPSPSSHTRSPGLIPSHFSPPHSGESPQQHHIQNKTQSTNAFSNQNSASGQRNASNPLQSLEKMVMIDSENSEVRSEYDGTQSNCTPITSAPSNCLQRSYYCSDPLSNNDPESPYPTYYNLDQNRLCTPPRPSALNMSYSNIPEDNTQISSDLSMSRDAQNCNENCDTKDKKFNAIVTESNETNDNVNPPEKTHERDSHDSKSEFISNERKENDDSTQNDTVSMTENVTKDSAKMSNNGLSNKSIQNNSQDSRAPILSRRAPSRDSLHSSDSEPNHNSYVSDSHQTQWKRNPNESDYYINHDNKQWQQQWSQNGTGQLPQPPKLSPVINPVVNPNYPIPECRPPNLIPVPAPNPYQSPMLHSGSWSSSIDTAGTTTPPNSLSGHFGHCDDPYSSHKKKRGRPYGSKNKEKRRDSEEHFSEKSSSSVSSPKKAKKVTKVIPSKVEIGINTFVSINPFCCDELTLVNKASAAQSTKKKPLIGPYVRIEKGKGKGYKMMYSIVNVTNKQDDEKDIRGRLKTVKQEPNRQNRRPSIGATKKVSTFSPHYDLANHDTTWVCALCHKGPHYRGIGDLYGPYNFSGDEKAQQTHNNPNCDSIDETINAVVANEKSQIEKKTVRSEKRRRSDASESGTNSNKKSPQLSKPVIVAQTPQSSTSQATSVINELWVHEDCAVWSCGVYLVGHRVRNLEEIIKDSNESICSKCKLSGATLGCLQKSCTNTQYHYLCAKEKGCQMDEENFSLYCPKHKKKMKETKTNDDSSIFSSPKS